MREVSVRLSTGKIVNVSLADCATDDQIKLAVQEKEGVPPALLTVRRTDSPSVVVVDVALKGGLRPYCGCNCGVPCFGCGFNCCAIQ